MGRPINSWLYFWNFSDPPTLPWPQPDLKTKSVCKLLKITGGASPDILARPSLHLPDANLMPWLDPPSLPPHCVSCFGTPPNDRQLASLPHRFSDQFTKAILKTYVKCPPLLFLQENISPQKPMMSNRHNIIYFYCEFSLSGCVLHFQVIDCVTDTLDAVDTGMVWMVDQAQYK